MLIGIRIVKSKYTANAFDGEGARLHGGRWNSPGTAVVYTAQSEALAILELLVQLNASDLLKTYSTISAEFDDKLVEVVSASTLPTDWRGNPAPSVLQQIGDQWVSEKRSAALQIPSAIVPSELNFILNPNHTDFKQVNVGTPKPLELDPRFAL